MEPVDKCRDHAQNIIDLVNLICGVLRHVNALSLTLVPGLQKPQGIGEHLPGILCTLAHNDYRVGSLSQIISVSLLQNGCRYLQRHLV